MALDPNMPWSWVPPEWDQSLDPYADPLSLASTLGPRGTGPGPVPPPPPPPPSLPGPPDGYNMGTSPLGIVGPDGIPHGNAADWPPQHWSVQADEVPASALPPPIAPATVQAPVLPWEEDPALTADATSGAAPTPDQLQNGDTREPVNPYTGVNSPDVDEQVVARKKLWLTDPAAAQALEARELAVQQDKALAEQERINADDVKQAVADRARVQAARDKADAMQAQIENDSAALAKQKVDPDRWWSNRSTGQKVAGYIAAIVGGLAQSASGGGRNVGLDMINKAIDDDIAAQGANLAGGRADLARRQGVVAELYSRTGDLEHSMESARRASKMQALDQLQVEMQKYDPAGTTARRLVTEWRAGLAQVAKDDEKRYQQTFENQLKVGELGIKADAAALAREKEARRVAGAGSGQLTPQQFREKYAGIIPVELLPNVPMTEKDFSRQLETSNKGLEAKSKIDARRIPGVMPDGADFLANAGTDADVSKVRDQVTAGKGLVRLIDDARRIRTGWSSDLTKNEEWQRLKTIWGNAKAKGKNALGLGALSDSDFELLGQYLGTDDPTKSRGVEAAVLQARKNIVSDSNDALHSIGYPGVFDIKDLQAKTPEMTQQERELAEVLGADKHNARADNAKVLPSANQTALIEKWAEIATTPIKDGLTPEQRSAVEAEQKMAWESITKAANSAKVDGVKEYAAKKLQDLAAPSSPTTEEIGGPRGNVVHETAPPVPEKKGKK